MKFKEFLGKNWFFLVLLITIIGCTSLYLMYGNHDDPKAYIQDRYGWIISLIGWGMMLYIFHCRKYVQIEHENKEPDVFEPELKLVVYQKFTLIWYREMKTGKTTHYTQPFRTTVKAKTYEEAVEKVTEFAIGRSKLVIMDQEGYENSNIGRLNKALDSFEI